MGNAIAAGIAGDSGVWLGHRSSLTVEALNAPAQLKYSGHSSVPWTSKHDDPKNFFFNP